MDQKLHSNRSNRTLTDAAYEFIKGDILKGAIAEGTFLQEIQVREKYNLGRTPFREACNRLHHEELLEIVPRRGYFVPEISFRDVLNLFEVRLTLEGAAAELATARATEAQIAEGSQLIEEAFPPSNLSRHMEAFVDLNTRFHLLIASMTQNREFFRLLEAAMDRNRRISYLEFAGKNLERFDLHLLHKPILDAIRKRDPQAAKLAVTKDIQWGQELLFGRSKDWVG